MRVPRAAASAILAFLLALGGCGAGGPVSAPSGTENPRATPLGPPAAPTQSAHSGPERFARPAPTRPSEPTLAAVYRAALVSDPCVDRDLPAPPVSDPALVLLDRTYALPASFVPDELVPASEAGFDGASGTKLVAAAVVEDLAALRAASEAESLTIVIDSAYRSYAAQEATFGSWATQIGLAAALERAARPGHSEHQLGTAVDVSSPGWSGRFGDWAAETPEGAWMALHAWEYGWVMSYPPDAKAETCFAYEPWHYRWIGRAAAAEHRSDGTALRTFLAERAGG